MAHVQATVGADTLTLTDRIDAGFASVREIVGKVWPYVLAGIAIGAGIHGYVPQDFMASFMGKDAWWSVPVSVLIGVPMYTNAAGIIPIVEALLAKGAALGTVLAFMMSVIALSLPEMVILRKVLKPRLIATFVGVVATGHHAGRLCVQRGGVSMTSCANPPAMRPSSAHAGGHGRAVAAHGEAPVLRGGGVGIRLKLEIRKDIDALGIPHAQTPPCCMTAK